jgi:hypothetical protein
VYNRHISASPLSRTKKSADSTSGNKNVTDLARRRRASGFLNTEESYFPMLSRRQQKNKQRKKSTHQLHANTHASLGKELTTVKMRRRSSLQVTHTTPKSRTSKFRG